MLADFQRKAVANLLSAMGTETCDIILKSCTGSGKTLILTHFIAEYLRTHPETVFIWLTPGKGNLEEQSKEKMDQYIHGSSTKLLSDVMFQGFEGGDVCFINWELITNKKNTALREGEKINFLEHIEKAQAEGLSFKIIIDEAHSNDTIKAEEILTYFKTDKIIRSSATPKGYRNAQIIEILDGDVIDAGLIKKLIVINEDFEENVLVDDQISYLIDKALEKQTSLRVAYSRRTSLVNPLILIQLPNSKKNDSVLLKKIEQYLESRNITYDNQQLAVWLSEKKENTTYIEKNTASPIILIMKQAISLGWDCPRAQILVKLRDNMTETFEIQTIGRIRRMPEAHHYDDDLLDSCYLYTFDSEFVSEVKITLGKEALSAKRLTLKPEYQTITLMAQQKKGVTVTRDAQDALRAIVKHFEKKYGTNTKTVENREKLIQAGYVLDGDIVGHTKSGEVAVLEAEKTYQLETVQYREKLNTNAHRRAYQRAIDDISTRLSLDYHQMVTIMRRLFDRSVRYDNKILSLSPREMYPFVLNNVDRLRYDILQSMAEILEQQLLKFPEDPNEVPFKIPSRCIFTYDSSDVTQEESLKNVYAGYLSSAEPRSIPERKFEMYCESSENITWFYKNGDKGREYFSILYLDSFGKEKAFYPDYIVGTTSGDIWIIETKGGVSTSGQSQDIDRFSARKFEYLKHYLAEHNLKGGFVRAMKERLYICTEKYDEDVLTGEHWRPLSDYL